MPYHPELGWTSGAIILQRELERRRTNRRRFYLDRQRAGSEQSLWHHKAVGIADSYTSVDHLCAIAQAARADSLRRYRSGDLP